MTSESPARGKFQLKIFATGVLLVIAALCMGFGGCLLGYRAIDLLVRGVEGKAIVQENLGEVVSTRRGIEFRNHRYVLAFDGRTLERQMPDLYEVGSELDITYVPGTVNMELTADRWPLWQSLPVSLLIILAGLGFGFFGYAFLQDGLGIPLPASDGGAAETSPEQFAS